MHDTITPSHTVLLTALLESISGVSIVSVRIWGLLANFACLKYTVRFDTLWHKPCNNHLCVCILSCGNHVHNAYLDSNRLDLQSLG